jgi:hypothetical protein
MAKRSQESLRQNINQEVMSSREPELRRYISRYQDVMRVCTLTQPSVSDMYLSFLTHMTHDGALIVFGLSAQS